MKIQMKENVSEEFYTRKTDTQVLRILFQELKEYNSHKHPLRNQQQNKLHTTNITREVSV